MILSDRDIRLRVDTFDLKIKPFRLKQLQPSSYDLTLSQNFWKMQDMGYRSGEMTYSETEALIIVLRDPPSKILGEFITSPGMIIRPGEFILGTTIEKVQIPVDLVARLEGKSSLGRLGLIVHATAGYVDPGFSGHLTLELYNLGTRPIKMYYAMRIAQITFLQMTSAAERPYGHSALGSRYQAQGESPVPYRVSQSEKV